MDTLSTFTTVILLMLGALSGVPAALMLFYLRARKSKLSIPALLSLPSAIGAYGFAWWMMKEHNYSNLEFLSAFLGLWALFAWALLPTAAVRRVERFERELQSKGVTVLNSQQARKRLKLAAPFILHPATLPFLITILWKRGKLLYPKRLKPKQSIWTKPLDMGGWEFRDTSLKKFMDELDTDEDLGLL